MRVRLFLLFSLVLFSWSGQSKLEIATLKRVAACHVAEIVVIDWPKFHGEGSYRFSLRRTSPDDEIGTRFGIRDYDIRENRVSPKWPKALMRELPQSYFDAFRFQTMSHPFAQCPNLGKVVHFEGHSVGNAPQPIGPPDPNPWNSLVVYDRPFVSFSLPYLSEDGRDALFFYRTGGSNDSGHSSVVLYRKNNSGVWEMVDEIGVSVV